MKNQKRDTAIVLCIGIASYVMGISAPLVSMAPNGTAYVVPSHNADNGAGGDDGVEILIRIPDPCGLKDVQCKGETSIEPEAQNTPLEKSIKESDSKVSILKKVCLEGQIIAENCWKTLLAIHLTETGGNCKAVGDQKRSLGCFQIRQDLHKLATTCYWDLECSAAWTLERMKKYGYPIYASYAIRRHNGAGQLTYVYLSKVNAIKEKL